VRGVPRQAEPRHGGGPHPCQLRGAVERDLRGRAERGRGHSSEQPRALLRDAIVNQRTPLVPPDSDKVAWWCYREAAEVHTHPRGMDKLAVSYYTGAGVTPDPAQAAVWFQKAADLGFAASKGALGAMLLNGDPRAGVAQDEARGFALVRQSFAEGCSSPLCYLKGQGVEKDAAHGVSLLRQVVTQEDAQKTNAETTLTICYMEGNGVDADTVQAALWCQQAATSGNELAIRLLPVIRKCSSCGTTPARKHCERCRKVRYCSAACQAAHWKRETDPHKGHCRRAAEASQQEAGGASMSAQ